VGDRTYEGLERALGWTAAVLFCLLLASGVAAGAAALLADCPAWLATAVALVGCAFLAVCLASDLVHRIAHVPRLHQAAAKLGFLPATTDIPAERRPEHARSKVKNVFRGDWDGHDVQLFEFEFVWVTTEHNHRETRLCAATRTPGDLPVRAWEQPGGWNLTQDGPWLFCWGDTRIDSVEAVTELLATLRQNLRP
jgi:hypothetical protein